MAIDTFEYAPPNLYGGLITAIREDKLPANAATVLQNVDLRQSVARGGLVIRKGVSAGVSLTAFPNSVVTGAVYFIWGSVKRIFATLSTGELIYADDTGTYPLTPSTIALPAGVILDSTRMYLAQVRDKVLVVNGNKMFGIAASATPPTTSPVAGFEAFGIVASPRAVATWLSRAFVCGSKGTGNADTYYDSRVWFSAVSTTDPLDFTSANNAGYIDLWHTRPLIALANAGNAILVFSRSQIWALIGENVFTFQIHKIADFGTFAQHSVASTHRSVIFASASGIYESRPKTGLRRISDPIQNIYERADLENVTLSFDNFYGQLWVTMPLPDTNETRIFVYNLELNNWQEYVFGGGEVTALTKGNFWSVPSLKTMFGSFAAGKFLQFNKGTTDSGVAITAVYRSPQIAGAENTEVSAGYLYSVFDSGGVSLPAGVTYSVGIHKPDGVALDGKVFSATLPAGERYLYQKQEFARTTLKGIKVGIFWDNPSLVLTGWRMLANIETVGLQ